MDLTFNRLLTKYVKLSRKSIIKSCAMNLYKLERSTVLSNAVRYNYISIFFLGGGGGGGGGPLDQPLPDATLKLVAPTTIYIYK